MGEEWSYYYNELIDGTANAEAFGTSLQNLAEDDYDIRKVKVTIYAESIALAEGAFCEVTKRASRAQSVGWNPPTANRTPIAGSNSALTSTADMNKVSQTTDYFARGQFTLEQGESLYSHLTEYKDGGTYDVFVEVWGHY